MPVLAIVSFGACSVLGFGLSTAAAMKYRSLVAHTIFMLAIQSTRVTYNALIYFNFWGGGSGFNSKLQMWFWLIVDAYCLLDAVSLVLISSVVRTAYLRFYGLGKAKVHAPITFVASSNAT
ncbi:hypothetical protein AAVH_20039 [Aphelenchoides avenae]|nr:hypothetical protein AAVH_20039 [Aphelenchus avenae]